MNLSMVIKCQSAIPSRFCHCVPILITHIPMARQSITEHHSMLSPVFWAPSLCLGPSRCILNLMSLNRPNDYLRTIYPPSKRFKIGWKTSNECRESPAIYLIKYFLCHCPVKWIRNEQSSSVSSQNID